LKQKVIVIGGGPAGMMAAIQSAKLGNDVTLIEKMRTCGRKLSITGKGRCNITNNIDINDFIKNIPGNGKFLYSAFSRFTNKDLINYINQIGVPTKVERGERVFPKSDRALDVVNALKRELVKFNVRLLTNMEVQKINTIKENNNLRVYSIKTNFQEIKCDKIILATGGKSYPLTGSDGKGYILAKELGHSIINPKGSLVPLETYKVYDLQGLTLKNVSIIVLNNKKKIYDDFGEMIFTHFGLSGPIILSASSHILREKNIEEKLKNKEIKLIIDLKPALSIEKLEQRIKRDFEKYTRKQFKNSLNDLLPSKLIPVVVELSKIKEEKQVDNISKEEIKQLAYIIKNFEFLIKNFRPIEEAIVTSGGVSTNEINSKTMESKLINGLYFAGEIIDVDAYTGGFNLQIAFSTGYVAGIS